MKVSTVIREHEILDELPGIAGAFGREPKTPNTSHNRGWCRKGLEALVDNAAAEFTAKTGVSLPYNLGTHGPWVSWRRVGKHFHQKEEMVSAAARLAGWLVAAAEFPALVRLIERTTGKGMNSRRTSFDFYAVSQRFSPGRLNNLLPRARRRANAILLPYGLRVSTKALVASFSGGSRRLGKIARNAAAETINLALRQKVGGYLPVRGKKSVELLVKSRGIRAFLACRNEGVRAWVLGNLKEFENLGQGLELATHRLVRDVTDGVELMLDQTTSTTRWGVEAIVGWSSNGSMFLVRQTKTGRTYHCSRYYAHHPENIKWAVRDAIKAWRKQENLKKKRRFFLSNFETDEVCHLVTIEDARAAGNCLPGIEAWLKQQGWSGRWHARPSDLFAFVGEERVMNTLKAAERRIQRIQQQGN